MESKRVISGLIAFPVLAGILILGNKYIVDVVFSIIAIFCIHEFYKSFRQKLKPVESIGYIAAGLIAFIHIIPSDFVMPIIMAIIPAIILVLFLHVIISNMRINAMDAAITLFGICYIIVFILFLALIYGRNNGNLLIWYIFFSAWGTDVLAYFIGKKFGKHKLKSNVSPNKSVEGCIAGILGSIIFVVLYTVLLNKVFNFEISYIYSFVLAISLSIISQIGDLSASSIKRCNEIKDFSNLIPGHGGMLDRFDSVIFIAPFAYFLLSVI